MGHQVIKLQNPLKTLGFLQFYRFKTVKDRIIQVFPVLSMPASGFRDCFILLIYPFASPTSSENCFVGFIFIHL